MSVFERVWVRGKPRSSNPDEYKMPLIDHIMALRRALIVSIVAWILASIAGFFLSSYVITFLAQRAGIKHFVYFSPTGAFMVDLKIGLILGVVLAMPVIIQQAWWFVSPGLYEHERRLILPFVLGSIIFFFMGAGFAFFSLPLFMRILLSFGGANLEYLADINQFINFVLILVVAYGIVFEMPVVLVVLGRMGIISSQSLKKNRFYWIIGLLILANLATPGVDPITPLFMFFPLYILWELSVFTIAKMGH